MKETVETRLARAEERQTALTNIVIEIKDNHLVHLQKELDNLSRKVDKLTLKIAMWTGGISVVMYVAERIIFK